MVKTVLLNKTKNRKNRKNTENDIESWYEMCSSESESHSESHSHSESAYISDISESEKSNSNSNSDSIDADNVQITFQPYNEENNSKRVKQKDENTDNTEKRNKQKDEHTNNTDKRVKQKDEHTNIKAKYDQDSTNVDTKCQYEHVKIGENDYFIEKILYKSNVSKVYIAHTHKHRNTQTTTDTNNSNSNSNKCDNCDKYVIKKYLKDYIQQAHTEYNILKLLKSNHIVSIVDKDIDNGILVMHRFYHDLFDLLVICQTKKKKLSKHSIKKYFTELIDTVHYMHKNNIVHLDIKPENILLTKDHHILFIDFGFSMLIKDGVSLTRLAKGTPFYAAPEIDDHNIGYDTFKSDVWSLGITLYLLLERKRPFNLDSLQSKGKNIDIDDVWDLIHSEKLNYHTHNEYYKEYHNLISRMLEKNPKHRWTIERVKEENDKINKKYMHINVSL